MLAQAQADQKNYDALNYRDDQFDLSDALLAIAISMLAVSSLTQLLWLYALSLVPPFFGVLMGVAGLVGCTSTPTSCRRCSAEEQVQDRARARVRDGVASSTRTWRHLQ